MDQGPELIPKVVGKRESNHGAFSLWSSTSSISKSHNEGSGGAILAWKDVSVEVVSWKGESKSVVQGLSGYVEPGQLMAIMGPSGSGKTTMLDALSGILCNYVHYYFYFGINTIMPKYHEQFAPYAC
mgnify:CR=1 FL=1